MSEGWRPLNEAEIATWPKARLGGALLGLTVVTGVLSLVLLILLLAAGRHLMMDGAEGVARMFGGGSRYFLIGIVSATATLAMLIWSAVTFTLIMLRPRPAQAIIATGAAIVFLVGLVASATAQWLIADQTEGGLWLYAVAILPIVPQWLGSLALTIGTIGYIVGGVRPNAYFRRRAALPSS